MKDILIKLFMACNAFLIRITGGRMGSKLGTQTILILHTIGRKSGLARAVPIAYFDFEAKFLIVASNWGKDRQADWYLNLKKQPTAKIDLKGRSIAVRMREAEGEEYARLWKFAAQKHPPYINYQKMTTRHIPIVVLEPV
jgi:deazaflavin-dependent oxidoreductase (nitroreductase family)